jgi:flagellar basal-body rod protein FlgG
MVRGMYTSASGMITQAEKIATISNNLANVNTTSYKEEELIFKEFPQMLLRRMNDKVLVFDFGSIDIAPIVGKIGTGVEVNEKFINYREGNLLKTENKLDIALLKNGFFSVETPYGIMYTRNGELNLDNEGYIVTKDGYKVLGEKGYINVIDKDFIIDRFGQIFIKDFNKTEYQYLDRILFYNFPDIKYLEKVGNSFYRETDYSGKPYLIDNKEMQILSGFIETSNVNPITEMVRLIEAQRAFEANSKALQSHDILSEKAVNQVGKV